jgi:ubiquinone/menaquinone biosynthesis C-methylase UbiE
MLQDRERHVLGLLKRAAIDPLNKRRLLEVGCGTGLWLRDFVKWGIPPENITGVELIPERAAQARHLSPESLKIELGSATKLAFPDASFDLVLQSTVFSSILDSETKRAVAFEMLRVVKEGGAVIWYDFYVNYPWHHQVRGVRKKEILELFPGCTVKLKKITLAPPVCRALANYSLLGCFLLSKVPWLCTHYLGLIRKKTHSG